MQNFGFENSKMDFLYAISMATDAHKVCCIVLRCKLPFLGTRNRGVKNSEETHIPNANTGKN